MSELIDRRSAVDESPETASTSSDSQEPYIGNYNDAPEFTLDNKYLLTGYRINYSTAIIALKSIFQWHNETTNIWTHGVSLLIAIIGTVYSLYQIPFLTYFTEINDQLSVWPLRYSLCTSIYLFSVSTTYHTFFCMNRNLSCFLLRVDYSGICLIASGGMIPAIQYGFYCTPHLRDGYTALVLIACLVTWILSLSDFMHKEHFVVQKTLFYVLFYTIALIPVYHLLYYNRLHLLGPHFDLYYIEILVVIMLIFLITGITFYASRFPERYYPKRFDLCCNSHTIWHIFVILAYSTVYIAGLELYAKRSLYLCS